MLNSFEVVNGIIDPLFQSDIYEYNVTVDENVVTLILDYKASDGAVVTVYGNDYLTEGENHVLIEVYDEKLITYTLNVYKNISQEASNLIDTSQKVEIRADSWYQNLITPGIGVCCFLTIVVLLSIIFRKK